MVGMGKEKKPPKLTKDNRVYVLECPAPYKFIFTSQTRFKLEEIVTDS